MVEKYVSPRGITDPAVLRAMSAVPRHLFIEEALHGQAYSDSALPIGEGQSISRPCVVARMTQELGLSGGERVLEIGGGSAYQSAVLSHIAKEVFSIERFQSLASRARKVLLALRLNNVLFKVGDGTLGWKDKAPFDAILVAASAPAAPPELLNQLKDGGRMVIPVGKGKSQRLMKYIKNGDIIEPVDLGECNFVPLIGRQGWKEEEPNA